MNRKQLLIEVKESKSQLVSEILEQDEIFLSRTLRNLNDQIQDKNRELKRRLSAEESIDQSVVEVLYKSLGDLKAKVSLYESFQKEFYS